MLNPEFKCISDFIKFKTDCVFCGKTLVPFLKVENSILTVGSKLLSVRSKLSEGVFVFKIKYTSISQHVDTFGSIDIATNLLYFDLEKSQSSLSTISYADAVAIFEGLYPQIELQCVNKQCKMNYYICSHLMSCEKASAANGGGYFNFGSYTRIKPFRTAFEACNVSRFWVQNDWTFKKTKIFSTKNPDADPIVVPMLEFIPNTQKFKNKVLTFITFR
jgi:hypothetical protein